MASGKNTTNQNSFAEKEGKSKKAFRNNPENRKPGQGNTKPAMPTTIAIRRIHRRLAIHLARTAEFPRRVRTATQNNQPGTSYFQPATQENIPMEEGEISSDSELAPSELEAPTNNWAKYIGVKSVQYIKMGPAPEVQDLEQNNWDLENTIRETEKEVVTDLQLLMTETTNDPKLLKTIVC